MSKGYDVSKDIVTFYIRKGSEILNITELYIEEDHKFDSKDLYCKEMIDLKYLSKDEFQKNNYDIIDYLHSQFIRKPDADDKYALKSENKELKTKIAELESRIAALEAK